MHNVKWCNFAAELVLRSGNSVAHIIGVKLHWARLVLGLVTTYNGSTTSGHSGPLGLAVFPWVGAMNAGNGFDHRW